MPCHASIAVQTRPRPGPLVVSRPDQVCKTGVEHKITMNAFPAAPLPDVVICRGSSGVLAVPAQQPHSAGSVMAGKGHRQLGSPQTAARTQHQRCFTQRQRITLPLGLSRGQHSALTEATPCLATQSHGRHARHAQLSLGRHARHGQHSLCFSSPPTTQQGSVWPHKMCSHDYSHHPSRNNSRSVRQHKNVQS